MTALVRAAEMRGLSTGQWLMMALLSEVLAALIYFFYWALLRKSIGYGAGTIVGAAIMMAAGGVVFLVVAAVSWLRSLS
ncbi:MAG TPA: hypothetical protein VGC04_01845 [Cellulomonas sp.]